MKYLPLIGLLLIAGIAGAAWWFSQPHIDSTGKMHVDLYEGANDTWDPQMEILPFDRAPSSMLTLLWQPPTASYNHFLISISTADGTLLRKESGEHDRLSLDVDGLAPETEYLFALQACLDPRCSEWLIAQQEYRGTTSADTTSAEVDISSPEN